MTPEELRWRAAAWAPEKARRNQRLQYILLGAWITFTAAWIIAIALGADLFNWWCIVVLICGYFNCIAGIINNRRIQKGRRPWGDI